MGWCQWTNPSSIHADAILIVMTDDDATTWAFRCKHWQLDEIRRRAKERDISTTAYVLGAALGTIDVPRVDLPVIAGRVDELERRVAALEAQLTGDVSERAIVE